VRENVASADCFTLSLTSLFHSHMIAQIIFIILLTIAGFIAYKRFAFVRRNVLLGHDVKPEGTIAERATVMIRVALGQGKMFKRPGVAILHFFIYAGFIIINLEVLEIMIDGIFGTHRIFSPVGSLYNFLIGSFEILAFLVLVSCLIFLARRNVVRVKRFWQREMTKWPRTDANLILITEVLLMTAFLTMNACDYALQHREVDHYFHGNKIQEGISKTFEETGYNPDVALIGGFPLSSHIAHRLSHISTPTLIAIERSCWWFHIIGILAFIVYLTYSKHLHIILAFPNTYFSKLDPPGEFNNLQSVTNEVKLMLDPSAVPPPSDGTPTRFGAKDVFDLSWVNLMNAYSCTECGRCTAECPANQTGKLLSPRKIMMDTRDRLEEVGKKIDAGRSAMQMPLKKQDQPFDDGRALLHDYITSEELWACTTCNACTNACPVNIDPLAIIIDLRRYLIMEESKSPESITAMFNNIENNGAPWAMSAADRAAWAES